MKGALRLWLCHGSFQKIWTGSVHDDSTPPGVAVKVGSTNLGLTILDGTTHRLYRQWMLHSVKTGSALQFVAYARERSDGVWDIRFPDAKSVTITAQNEQRVPERARYAIEKHLRQQLSAGVLPSWPEMHLPPQAHEKRCHINVPAGLAIAVQIRRLRLQRGWSQTDLAGRVGVSQQQIAKVEDPDANPTVDTITKIANVFAQPLVVVFGGSVDMVQNTRRN